MNPQDASRLYGFEVSEKLLEARTEHLVSFDEKDLVKAHLKSNYAYFGAIDKTLSGFFILDDEGDNYYILDCRDTGQVFWQDHETREVSLRFSTLDDYIQYKKELTEAIKEYKDDDDSLLEKWGAKSEKQSSRIVSTPYLDARYQWLVWFFAQPMKHFDDDAACTGAFGRLPKTDQAKIRYEQEKSTLTTDVHLAIFWLLHWVVINNTEMVQDVLEATKNISSELFTAFKEKFAHIKLNDTFPDILPTFNRRRSHVNFYRVVTESPQDISALIDVMEMDPEYMGLEKLLNIADLKPQGENLNKLQAFVQRASKNIPAIILAQALLDLWQGKTESESAVSFAKIIADSKEPLDQAYTEGFILSNGLIHDEGLKAQAIEKLLTADPYNFVLIQLYIDILQHMGKTDQAARYQKTYDAIMSIRPIMAGCQKGKGMVEDSLKQAETLPEDKRRLFAERILFRSELCEEKAVEQSIIWICTLGSAYRVPLLRKAFREIGYSTADVIKKLRKEIPVPDQNLAADLRKVVETYPTFKNMQQKIVDQMTFDDLRKQINAWLGTTAEQ